MEKKNIICTCCPMGCHMEVMLCDGKITQIRGNTCKRGENYAKDEITCKKRTLTSTVKTDNGTMLSVKTEHAIPFDKMTQAMQELSKITAKAPVKIGDVILEDICGTGVRVIATKNS